MGCLPWVLVRRRPRCCKESLAVFVLVSVVVPRKGTLKIPILKRNYFSYNGFGRSRGAGASPPSHSRQVGGRAPRPVGWTVCFLLTALVPVRRLCVNNIYMCIPYMSSVLGRIYILYNGSVVQYWRGCTPSRSIGLYFWGVRGSWAECLFLFSLVYQLCLILWYKSNTRMLVTFGVCLNNTLILGIWCSIIPHLPGCFCPWTFFEKIGFNTVLTDPLCHIQQLNLDILQGSFRLCNWLSLRRLVSWINHLPPACWSTFWKSNLKKNNWAVDLT